MTKITAYQLEKDPSKILRLNKSRRNLCVGGCGRWTWDDKCRKCQRAYLRKIGKK